MIQSQTAGDPQGPVASSRDARQKHPLRGRPGRKLSGFTMLHSSGHRYRCPHRQSNDLSRRGGNAASRRGINRNWWRVNTCNKTLSSCRIDTGVVKHKESVRGRTVIRDCVTQRGQLTERGSNHINRQQRRERKKPWRQPKKQQHFY